LAVFVYYVDNAPLVQDFEDHGHGPQRLPWARNAFRYTGLMVKIQDERGGEIYPDNKYRLLIGS